LTESAIPPPAPPTVPTVAAVAGWLFLGFGVLALGNCVLQFGNDKAIFFNSLWTVLLLGLPGLAIVTLKSRVAAGFLAVLATIGAVLCLGGGAFLFLTRKAGMGLVLALVGLLWVGMAWLTWRALAALVRFHRARKAFGKAA
jgi:hypothetical protein